MAELLKKVADFLGIEEEKKGEIASLPKPRQAVKGISTVPNSRLTPKGSALLSSTIEDEAIEKMKFNRPMDKPVRPLQLSDYRRNL